MMNLREFGVNLLWLKISVYPWVWYIHWFKMKKLGYKFQNHRLLAANDFSGAFGDFCYLKKIGF